MSSVLSSHKGRILSNYMRLLAGLVVGLLVTRILLSQGEVLFGVYTTITIGIGVSIMLTELLRMGFVPELGRHINDGKVIDVSSFQSTLAATFLISIVALLLGALVMVLLGLWLMPNPRNPELEEASWVFLWLRIMTMAVIVGVAPAMSVLLVSGRQQAFNLFLFLERLSELIGVIVPLSLLSGQAHNADQLLISIGIGVSFLTIVTYLVAARIALSKTRHFRPATRLPSWSTFKSILGRVGWSSLQTISMNLYVRSDILIIALFLGPTGTVALGVAIRLMGYVRQATTGLVNGLDATFANMEGQRRRSRNRSGKDNGAVIHKLVAASTSLQANVVFQISVIILLLSEQIVHIWIGDLLNGSDSSNSVSEISRLSSLMVIGIGFRSLNLGWMSAMTGSGNARHFTPWLLPGAILNVVILLGSAILVPEVFSVTYVGWVFLILQSITHGIIIPFASARSLGIPIQELLSPLTVPFIISLISFVLGYAIVSIVDAPGSGMEFLGVIAVAMTGLAAGIAFAILKRKL